jgi:hypothetical protein
MRPNQKSFSAPLRQLGLGGVRATQLSLREKVRRERFAISSCTVDAVIAWTSRSASTTQMSAREARNHVGAKHHAPPGRDSKGTRT